MFRILFRIARQNYEYSLDRSIPRPPTYGKRWNEWRHAFMERAITIGRCERPTLPSLSPVSPTELVESDRDLLSSLEPYADGYYGEYGRFGDNTGDIDPDSGSERDWEDWEREFGGKEAVRNFDFEAGYLASLSLSESGSAGMVSASNAYPGGTYYGHGRDRSVTISASDFLKSTDPPTSGEKSPSRSRTKSFTSSIRVFSGIGGSSGSRGGGGSNTGDGGGSAKRPRSSTVTTPFFGGR